MTSRSVSSRARSRALALVLLSTSVGILAISACAEDSESPNPTPTNPSTVDGGKSDGTTAADGATGSDTSTGSETSTGSDSATDTGTDAADGGGTNGLASCKVIHDQNPSAPSGIYTIDLDGAGTTYPPLEVYCDMTFDGGGWTMIQSFTGADSPGNLLVAGDSGTLVHRPEPGHLGGLADWIVQALAMQSTQVHIRLSFASDAGADGGTWVSTRIPDSGVTNAMQNLRNLDVLTKNTDGGYADWIGPHANAARLSWVPNYGGGDSTCYTPVQTMTKYPSIYWACGNFTSMNLLASQGLCRWNYTGGGNEPMEVFVR